MHRLHSIFKSRFFSTFDECSKAWLVGLYWGLYCPIVLGSIKNNIGIPIVECHKAFECDSFDFMRDLGKL